MTKPLISLLLRLSEGPGPAILSGRAAEPYCGAAFQRLLNERVLEERPLAEEWACCPGCSCELRVRLIERVDDRLLAICALDSAADVELTPNDLKSYSIDRRRLAEVVAIDRSEFDEPMPGLWRLGRVHGRCAFLILQSLVAEDPALLPMLRSEARGSEITLVAPAVSSAARRRLHDAADVRLTRASEAIALVDGGIRLRVSSTHPSGPFVPELSLCVRSRRVSVRGAPQAVPGQPFNLLELLVEAWERGAGVSGHSIEERFSGRPAKDLARDLRDALADGRSDKAEIRHWISSGGKPAEYRLMLPRGAILIS